MSCSPAPPKPPARENVERPPTPLETAECVIELRRQRTYEVLAQHITPPLGDEVVEVLLAVDDLLGANARLCVWIRDRVGIGLADTIDQSYIADDLDLYAGDSLAIFSRQVVLLDESVAADTAEVTFQIGERVPAKCVRWRLVDGRWLLEPELPNTEKLAEALHDIARGLEEVLAELESGQISAQALRDDHLLLMNKVKARLRRGVRLLSAAHAVDAEAFPATDN